MSLFVRRMLVQGIILMMFTTFAVAAPKPAKRPPVEFDTTTTPLQKAVKDAYVKNAGKKVDKMPGGEKKDKCADAIARGNENQIAQFCDDVGSAELTKLADQDLKHANGHSAGKRVVTRTKLKYRNPKQKGDGTGPAKWEPTKFKAFGKEKQHSPGPVSDPNGGRNLGGTILPDATDNNDKDCVDWVTSERFRGNQCFDATGKLIGTLTPFTDELGRTGCKHRGGSAFLGDATDEIEDECFDEKDVLKTTLVESIDEDGPDDLDNDGDGQTKEDGPGSGNEDHDCIDGLGNILRGEIVCAGVGSLGEKLNALIDEDGPDLIDNDGDGLFNEDGPDHVESVCSRLYTKGGLTPMASDVDTDGQCDLTRLMRKYVNDKAGKKIFNAKDDGTPDEEPGAEGIEAGDEEREITLTESFGVKCQEGTSFCDNVCVPDSELTSNTCNDFKAAMSLVRGPGPVAVTDADDPAIAQVAMMGFTFAPPVIEWGYKIDEDVCVLGICIEIFYARIGYEFDLAVGLRLPVEIEALDLPDSVLAGEEFTLQTTVMPLDFTAKQYSDFCTMHGLNNDWFISDCTRFGFPDFLDEMVPLIPANKKDGDEFVARYSVFAGLIVRVFGIPLLNWGIDSSLDIPAACTMMRILQAIQDLPEGVSVEDITKLVGFLSGLNDDLGENAIELLSFIKDVAGACGTFTTPFGEDEDGLRAWPFSGKYDIGADCAEALATGKVITVKGKARPICTNMILGVSGASLGIGLGLTAEAGSHLITADYSQSEDADTNVGDEVSYTRSANEDGSAVEMSIRPDNYNPADFKDTARVALDNFTYYLNALQVTLRANLEFGGILSPIPDIGSFPIYSFIIDSGKFGLPIPQHPGTEPVAINLPVENYGLKVDVKPESSDPAVRVDDKTLLIQPGNFGPYMVRTRNIGSRLGDFDNFRVAISNRPDQTAPYSYVIDQNTDHDCVVTGGVCMGTPRLRGDPYDGIADECYQANGGVRPDREECINEDLPETVEGKSREERDNDKDGIPDEDAPDVWATNPDSPAFGGMMIADLAPYTFSSLPPTPDFKSIRLSVNPFRHPLTRPGRYPFLVTADSVEAKAKSMAHTDPSGNRRVDATDTAFLVVKSFYEPQVVVLPNRKPPDSLVLPNGDGGKPGVERGYTIEGTNGGNSPDSMTVNTTFLDFNTGLCTLTTMGRPLDRSDCPRRAVPTVIPTGWTTVAGVPPAFPAPPGQLGPLDSSTAGFTIKPPRDWAGMDDTTYFFQVKTESRTDPALPPATRSYIARHKVTATKESMTRYIGLEITELTAVLVAADAAGVKLGGLKPVVMNPIQSMNDNALIAILAGNFSKASGNHATNINLVQALVKMMGDGKSLPPALYTDLKNRTAALIADMTAAQLSTVTSAP